MKALTYQRYGPPDVVQVADVPRPVPSTNEILIHVHASAVNTSDWRIRAAAFPGITALPARLMFGFCRPRNQRLGSEFAGVVAEVGPNVTNFVRGQRVFGITSNGGASAEYLTIFETSAVAEIPDTLSFSEAAALPFGGLAALVFLEQFAQLQPNHRLLIIGASGGVGSYAVQIGKALGAHVTGVSGSASQVFVRTLGADATVNYEATDLREIKDRFDIILDIVGGVSPRLSHRLLRPGGVFLPLNVGLREIAAAFLNPFRNRKIHLAVNPNRASDLKRLAALVRAGDVKPAIDSVYGMNDAAAAHAHAESRHRKGSLVLSITEAALA